MIFWFKSKAFEYDVFDLVLEVLKCFNIIKVDVDYTTTKVSSFEDVMQSFSCDCWFSNSCKAKYSNQPFAVLIQNSFN